MYGKSTVNTVRGVKDEKLDIPRRKSTHLNALKTIFFEQNQG
jgi:hypothetical protein